MNTGVERALALFGLDGAEWEDFALRENHIFRVRSEKGEFALRLHRPGYRTNAQLASELDWMAATAKGGISVPAPLPVKSGGFLGIADGKQVDILRWLPGQTLTSAMASKTANRIALIRSIGKAAARFHIVCDNWNPPESFERPDWGAEGLVGEQPVWGRFWENPNLSGEDARLFEHFRRIAAQDLSDRYPDLNYGLIHADLLGENVLTDGNNIHLIDFDDGGWGYRLFELSTALIRHLDAPDYADLKGALFAGYRSVRPLDTGAFDLMLALRACTYVGWIAERAALADAQERQERNAALARNLITHYLAGR